MKRLSWLLLLLPVFLLLSCSSGTKHDIRTEEIGYTGDSVRMRGYLAYDEAVSGQRPGVLVVHEWWGENDYARRRARMLAELGYVAFALDMYGGGQQANHPEDAGKFASAIMSNMPGAKARFLAALGVLKQNRHVDPSRIAAIGYCFGGGVVLNMARMGVDLKGVVSFHGSLGAAAPAEPGGIKASILVCNGADDPFTTADQIEAFKHEMSDARADLTFLSYPGAQHSFTNPDADSLGKKFNLPLAYNAAADTASWVAMEGFLKKIFAR